MFEVLCEFVGSRGACSFSGLLPDMGDAVDPELRHHETEILASDNLVTTEQRSFYQALECLSHGEVSFAAFAPLAQQALESYVPQPTNL